MNKTSILLTTKVRQRRGVLAKDVRGVIYIFDAATEKIYTLNETASYIWKHAQKPIAIVTIIQHLQNEFEVDNQEAMKDIKAFINNFVSLKFLEIV